MTLLIFKHTLAPLSDLNHVYIYEYHIYKLITVVFKAWDQHRFKFFKWTSHHTRLLLILPGTPRIPMSCQDNDKPPQACFESLVSDGPLPHPFTCTVLHSYYWPEDLITSNLYLTLMLVGSPWRMDEGIKLNPSFKKSWPQTVVLICSTSSSKIWQMDETVQ